MTLHSFFGTTLPSASTIRSNANDASLNFTRCEMYFEVATTCWAHQVKWRRPDTTAISATITGRITEPQNRPGRQLTSATIPVGTTAGWKVAALPQPLMKLFPGRWYSIEVVGSLPRLAHTANYFTTGLGRNGIRSGPLHAPNRDGSPKSGPMNIDNRTVTLKFQGYIGHNRPVGSHDDGDPHRADNYWVDVVVDDEYTEPPFQEASDMFTTILQH